MIGRWPVCVCARANSIIAIKSAAKQVSGPWSARALAQACN